jgi:hypothetical protein
MFLIVFLSLDRMYLQCPAPNSCSVYSSNYTKNSMTDLQYSQMFYAANDNRTKDLIHVIVDFSMFNYGRPEETLANYYMLWASR